VGLPVFLSYFMLFAGAVIIGLIFGPSIEKLCLRRIYGSDIHIQLLLTYSILLILDDGMKLIWGLEPMFVSEPYTFIGMFEVSGIIYPVYNLLLMAIAVVFGGFLIWLLRRTRFGKIVVSVIHDREVSVAMGVTTSTASSMWRSPSEPSPPPWVGLSSRRPSRWSPALPWRWS
jgi:branched-chain amino acid transport system permease protein